MHKIEN